MSAARSWQSALARGSAVAFGVRIAGTALALLTHVFLARWMGLAEYGTFIYVYTWSLGLGLLAKLGTDRAVVRYGAPLLAERRFGEFAALSQMAMRYPLLAGISIAVILNLAVYWIVANPDLRRAFLVGGIAIPLMALHHVHLALGQARKRVWLATVPEQILRQGLLGLSVAVYLALSGTAPTAVVVLMLHALAVILTLAAEHYWNQRATPVEARSVPRASTRPEWVRYSLHMTIISNIGAWTVQLDVLIVGMLLGASTAGIYSVASRMALLVPWVSLAALTLFSPVVAELAASGQRKTLQQYTTAVARAVALASLALASGIWQFHGWILSWFGPEYLAAALPLGILLCGYVLQDLFGPVAALMNLSGRQAATLRVVSLGALGGLVLQLLLVPRLGSAGAATAVSIVVVGNALALWILLQRQAGINSAAFHGLPPFGR